MRRSQASVIADASSSGWARVSFEVERSRRTGVKFVLARFSPELRRADRRQPSDTGADVLATAIVTHVRETDCVWHEGVNVYLLACDTDCAECEPLFERLVAEIPEVAARKITVACFPDDALTYEELTAAAVHERLPAVMHRPIAR